VVEERLLARIWGRQLVSEDNLVAGSGERLKVVYPGRENRDSGPDFRGAIIATEECGLLVGDVEIHRMARDWKSHGHHCDPRYNDVILQVVWDGETSVLLQNGKTVPTLSLCHCLKGSFDEVRCWAYLNVVPSEPCYDAHTRLGDDELGRHLDKAGEARFRLKASRFASTLAEVQPSEVLYQGIMGALGYTRNKEQFEELACCLPLAVMQNICRGKLVDEQIKVIKAMLLGMAGLLPDDEKAEQESLKHCLGNREPMSPSSWRVFRVRPENHPVRRLSGAAYLLARFMNEGLLEGVLRLLDESSSDIGRLEAGFMVGGQGYHSRGQRALIGQARAREIAVNIALPFAFAWAEANSQTTLAERALWLYRVYPRSGENEITRGLTKLLGSKASALVDSAQRQQGLIHLDKTFCRQRRCVECPLAISMRGTVTAP
jgi:Protein of unknown function (DUF2851)